VDRNLWGLHYFTERSVKTQLINFVGHFVGIGFCSVAITAGAFCFPLNIPYAFAVIPGPIISVGREIYQWVVSGKPHLLDRSRDVLEALAGTVTGWVVFDLWRF
jgi:hypothetical protein